MEESKAKMATSTETSSAPTSLSEASITRIKALPAWYKYVPGPHPTYFYKGLSARTLRLGLMSGACWCLMLSGYNLALMGNVSATASYLEIVGLNDGSQHTQLIIGTLNSVYWIGVIIGALLSGPVSDRFGRRKAIVCSGIYALIIVPLFASLQNFAWAITLRFLNGIATGAFDSVSLNWSAESADHRHRGRIVGLTMGCAAFGASQAYFLVYGIGKDTNSEVVWRFPIAYQLVFILLVLCSIPFLPESPRWLIRNDFVDESREILLALNADRGTPEEVKAQVESNLTQIQQALSEEATVSSHTSYYDMLFKRDTVYSLPRRTWSAIFVQFATQAMVGAGVASGYGMKIFGSGGWSADTSALLGGIGIIIQACFGVVGAGISDIIGRRRAMIYGAFGGGVMLSLIGMCGYFVTKYAESDPSKSKQYSSAVVAFVFIWSAIFGLTWLCTPFIYPTELFPAQYRARGSSFGIVGLGIGSFFINMIAPYIFSAITYNTMFLFCGTSLLLSVICYLWMPETSKKTLEDIDHLFDD